MLGYFSWVQLCLTWHTPLAIGCSDLLGSTPFDGKLARVAIIIDGDLTIGGGIPKITIRRLEWSLEGANSFVGQVRISGKIYGEVDERSFSFDLTLDD